MNKNLLLIVAIFIISSSAILFLLLSSEPQTSEEEVCFENQKCIVAEVVSTPEEMARGLMYRKRLEENRGMLFIFKEEGRYGFWMKNMNFPLDIIWISRNKTVAHIEVNLPPCKSDSCPIYVPDKKALYVLEVNANFSIRNNISIGSTVLF
ncbi:MAG: hypothetical protein DRO90_01405 [Candidatus Altiarchaeales archaeon]|nr:MAG: hypothetical protein DRO95_01290 [Candidatus Altiarchaeales archaeon]RLI94852.1 MAG: hypothetical protein DRO90_01405 [Candidatus Altiarchaeales archaeon]HDO82872.1 DUF192 domain-containing protein [Candidatus Altiarchaeales archaeon]HEX55521.1 DUF192 domain-containing protein [Candidatus Altiarchaeales archaeon]